VSLVLHFPLPPFPRHNTRIGTASARSRFASPRLANVTRADGGSADFISRLRDSGKRSVGRRHHDVEAALEFHL